MAARVAAFLSEAQALARPRAVRRAAARRAGDLVADTLREAAARGVAVRIAYNADHDERKIPPPPSTAPELIEALPFPTAGIPGIPDLMHHKYVVRDGEAVWTGSTNWTTDSWTLQENLVTVARSAPLAAAFTANFEELWTTRDVSRTGRPEPRARPGGRAAGARLVHARPRRGPLAADRRGDRARAAARADRLAGDHRRAR